MNTGEFTAPSDGLYSFSVSGLALSGRYAAFTIRHNNIDYCNAVANDNASEGAAGCSTVISLKAGDKVQCYDSSSKDNVVNFAYCSGFQI